MHMDIGPHLADDVLERYFLHRLPEAELASAEEHLLVCPTCQTRAEETEEFLLVTQAALRDTGKKPVGRALHAAFSGILHSWLSVPVFAAVVATIAAAIFLPVHDNPANLPPSEVRLSAMRGPDSPAHVRAGGELILDLDATGLRGEG